MLRYLILSQDWSSLRLDRVLCCQWVLKPNSEHSLDYCDTTAQLKAAVSKADGKQKMVLDKPWKLF